MEAGSGPTAVTLRVYLIKCEHLRCGRVGPSKIMAQTQTNIHTQNNLLITLVFWWYKSKLVLLYVSILGTEQI